VSHEKVVKKKVQKPKTSDSKNETPEDKKEQALLNTFLDINLFNFAKEVLEN
jgi:hypothetical protein